MKKFTLSWVFALAFFLYMPLLNAQQKTAVPAGFIMDTRIDNIGYWQKCAEMGLVPVQPPYTPVKATYTGTRIFNGKGILIDDSPDIAVTTEVSTQSENSIVIDPNNKSNLLNSNNATNQPSTGSTYGADYYHSEDEGVSWTGSKQGAGGTNSGDPAACINLNGRYFIGYIDAAYGQSVSYSDNMGSTWTVSKVANGTMFNMLDKNHLWVDISPSSPYKGNLYDAWMQNSQINVSRSITNGTSWEPKIVVSTGTNAGSHNQGENFKCGPDGEVYCVWAVYDNWPGDEKALGFSKSLDGGITWSPAVRILDNLKGIRTTGVSQNMRVNSFPSMACDLSNGPDHGALYVVWTNIGVPGINTGTDADVYMIKSSDEGATWSTPKRINTDASGLGKKHYMPWITCDQATGTVSIVYYDNRNLPPSQCEAYMAYSTDGGNTFEDLKVSDVSFTPAPIPNMAGGYMGDYLAIAAYNNKIYPCWTDNRLGYCMTYVSPVELTIPASQVVYNANTLNDTTFGNSNGKMDYGETEMLNLKLKNEGTGQGDSVNVTVTTDSPYITMLDSTEFYGDFAVGGSKNINSAFKFIVSDSIPHGISVPFYVTARDKVDTVSVSTFSILSHAPAITIMSMEIIDPLGNNNGRLDPGETATLKILTQNTGDYNALDAVSELTSSNPFVTIVSPVQVIGTLTPGQEVNVMFDVQVNPATPIGTATVIHNYAHAQTESDQESWVVKIGLIIEDWETGDFTKFPWQFAGDANWAITDSVKWEKIYSSGSGIIDHGQTSELFLEYNVLYDDSISFYRKTKSQHSADYLKFYIDGVMAGQWSGNVDFSYVSYPVLAGPHVFKWAYEKDATISIAPDEAWVDYIVFPPEYKTSITAGSDATICEGNTLQLNGLAAFYDSLQWSTSGTGIFTDPGVINTIYTPGPEDITAGSVVLTLTAWGYGQPVSSNVTLTISAVPTVTAGTDNHICAGSTFELTEPQAVNNLSLAWSTSGDGTFNDVSVINPVYTPGQQDITLGSVQLSVLNTPSTPCLPVSDTMTLSIKALPQVNLGPDSVLCGDMNIVLDATIPDGETYSWSNGATTPVITVDSTGIGIGSRDFTVDITDIYGCTTSDVVTIGFKSCTGITDMKGLGFSCYPNPASDNITLAFSSKILQNLSIRILSQSGSVVYTDRVNVSGASIKIVDLSKLANGNYIIEISNGTGKIIEKIVKQ